METLWQQAKKQGFSVVLLMVAVGAIFTYFTRALENQKQEFNARFEKVENKYEECIRERVNDLKNLKALSEGKKDLSIFSSKTILFVIPSKEENVFS